MVYDISCLNSGAHPLKDSEVMSNGQVQQIPQMRKITYNNKMQNILNYER